MSLERQIGRVVHEKLTGVEPEVALNYQLFQLLVNKFLKDDDTFSGTYSAVYTPER
jgi:hypothetical protein